MSALGSGKPFDDLTPEELAELAARDWSVDEILDAIGMALRDGALEAVRDLLNRLALKDPAAAQALVDSIGRCN